MTQHRALMTSIGHEIDSVLKLMIIIALILIMLQVEELGSALGRQIRAVPQTLKPQTPTPNTKPLVYIVFA